MMTTNKTVFDFYLKSHTFRSSVDDFELSTKIHMFKGTLDDFEKVEQLYGELWLNVIDSQLDLINFNDGYDVSKLTSDPILLNWEGSDIEAHQINNENVYHYLGDGKLEKIERVI